MGVLQALRVWSTVIEFSSRPLANRLERGAASRPMFGRLITRIGEGNYRLGQLAERQTFDSATYREIPPPSQKQVFQLAAEAVNELCGLTAVGAGLYWATTRKARKIRQETKALEKVKEELSRERDLLKHQLEQA